MDSSEATKKHPWSATVSMLKDLVAVLRDLFIFSLGVLLLAFPTKLNEALVSAGIEEGSIVGLKWKKGLVETNDKLKLAEDSIAKLRSENELWRKVAVDSQDRAISAISQVDLEKLKASAQRADDEAKQVQNSLAATLASNQDLLSKSPPPTPRSSMPSKAYCYQEDRLQDGMSRFSVHCHEIPANCEKARGPSKVRKQSACTLIDLTAAHWSPGHPGYIGSWYQFSREPFGAPFPQLQN